MKRLIYLPDTLQKRKYVLKNEYEGHGIYEEVCPAGWKVHQSWAIMNEKKGFSIMIQSYNRLCYEELLDAIDNYNETGKYGLKLITTAEGLDNNYRVMHPSGKES